MTATSPPLTTMAPVPIDAELPAAGAPEVAAPVETDARIVCALALVDLTWSLSDSLSRSSTALPLASLSA